MWFLWLLFWYYVPSVLVFLFILWLSRSVYLKVPFVYFRAVLLPFVGFWVFVLLWLDDLRAYFENERHDEKVRARGE